MKNNPQDLFRALAGNGHDDSKLALCYNLAVSNIKNYTRADGDVEGLFPNEVVALALHYLNQFGKSGIESFTQGNRSVKFSTDIPGHIKSTLPRYIKGW